MSIEVKKAWGIAKLDHTPSSADIGRINEEAEAQGLQFVALLGPEGCELPRALPPALRAELRERVEVLNAILGG